MKYSQQPPSKSPGDNSSLLSLPGDGYLPKKPTSFMNTLYLRLSSIILILLLANLNRILVVEVNAHGFMVDPVGRNSLWRVDGSAPVNYDDNELFCGGIGAIEQTGGKCGVCGDSYRLRSPRPHETGGYMVTNRTVKNYFPHSTMDVLINLETNHGGYFTFELCRRDSFEVLETEACFERLKFADGSDKYRLRLDHSDSGIKGFSLELPEDLTDCQACILRWNYYAGNNWGVCGGGGHNNGHHQAGMGCGPQELYRNCADITVGYMMGRLESKRQGAFGRQAAVGGDESHSVDSKEHL